MSIGKELKGFRERNNLSQKTLASDLYVDQTLVSKIEKGKRNATDEFLKNSANLFGDAQYGFSVAHETAKSYITPLATAGKAIEWHRLALEETFKREALEAIEKFNNLSLVKNPNYIEDHEVVEIEVGILELLDVQLSINSLLTILEQEYNDICIKSSMKKRLPKWKSEGWIE